MTDLKKTLEKTKKWLAKAQHAPKYNEEHMTGPEAEFVNVKAWIEYVGCFIKQNYDSEGGRIVILGRIVEHNIPDDAYGKASEGIRTHVRAELEANVPELEETGYALRLFDVEEGEDLVP